MENNDKILEDAFLLADPRHKTNLRKSRTAFISFHVSKGQIHFSAFLARTLGLMSGDKIGFIKHKNPLIWFIYKTNQDYRTLEVKIRNGTYSINNKVLCEEIAQAFSFNKEYTGKIRLYVNYQNPIKHQIKHPDSTVETNWMMQIFDVPTLREDFTTPELKEEYKTYMNGVSYIIKPNEIKDANNRPIA